MAEAEAPFHPTQILIAVKQSSTSGYPNASISCSNAFNCMLEKIVQPNPARFSLHLLHVLQREEDGGSKARGDQLLEHFVNRCIEIGVPYETLVKTGDAGRTICSEAYSIRPDLLVTGGRRIGFVRRLFTRKVNDYCLRHAGCSVLTVKRAPKNPADD